MSLDCLPMTHFQISHRATSARSCIVIDSQRQKNIGKPAHGGNARSFGNIYQPSRWSSCAKIEICSFRGARAGLRRLRDARSRIYFGAMPKEEQIVTEGTVTQVLPGTMFRVDLPGQRNVLAHISGKMRKHFIRIVPGDKVSLEVSPYDLTKARIIFREQ